MSDSTNALPSGFTKRDLKMVGKSLGAQYVVTVHQTQEGSGLWTVSLQFEGQEAQHSIETARGDMKVWRNVVSAITFVQENCKFASDVFVVVSGWKLARAPG